MEVTTKNMIYVTFENCNYLIFRNVKTGKIKETQVSLELF